MTVARYAFLPWARRGAGALITDVDSFGVHPLPLRPSVTLTVHLQPASDVEHAVALRGPADIVGFDERAVVRTDPRPGTGDFEPNDLAALELYDEDLPWRYSPARATPAHQLRPWIALVVLATDEVIRTAPGIIEVARADALFPAPADLWAWAHVHVNGTLDSDPARLDEAVRANPDLALSRLICPRRLAPKQAYTAFVLPSFEVGRRAALGLSVPDDSDGGAPAWGAGQTTFPVFYEWSFQTGAAGDFESLARLLQPRTLDARIGLRDLDVTEPAPELIDGITSPPVLGLEGALRTVDMVPTAWPAAGETFPARLAAIVNARATAAGDPMVTPPFYGQWLAARPTMGAPDNPPWLDALNRDPRHRAAASFGTEVIRRNQEELVAESWAQLGHVLDANRALVLAQAARATTRSLYDRHLASLETDRMLAVTAPLHRKVKVDTLTVHEQVRKSALTGAVVDRGFRRLVRAGGPMLRRFSAARATRTSWVTRMNAGELVAAPPKPLPVKALLVDAIPARMRVVASGSRVVATAARLHAAVDALHADLAPPPPPPTLPALALPALQTAIAAALDPSRSIPQRVLGRLRAPGANLSQRPDPLDRIMAAPEIDRPMYAPLAAISSDLLLPNVGLVPQNTVALLQTNNRFVESYLVGLNHEMARELLWRGYPTDQRGSYFRCFWDSRDSLAATPVRDIDAIHLWPKASDLGTHVAGGTDRLVLLVRGDLLKRYPSAVISAVAATWPAGGGKRELGTEEHYPLFHAELAPDLTLVGFDLDLAQTKGTPVPSDRQPGWFFVIKQRPGEPRFGFDETTPTLVGLDAAERASVLLRRPVLVAIHASEMLP